MAAKAVMVLAGPVGPVGSLATDGETCDGGQSRASADEAVRGFLQAVEADDPDAACRFVTNDGDHEQMKAAFADFRAGADDPRNSSQLPMNRLGQVVQWRGCCRRRFFLAAAAGTVPRG